MFFLADGVYVDPVLRALSLDAIIIILPLILTKKRKKKKKKREKKRERKKVYYRNNEGLGKVERRED